MQDRLHPQQPRPRREDHLQRELQKAGLRKALQRGPQGLPRVLRRRLSALAAKPFIHPCIHNFSRLAMDTICMDNCRYDHSLCAESCRADLVDCVEACAADTEDRAACREECRAEYEACLADCRADFEVCMEECREQ
ncbi:hypothetical protein [Thermofilum sp.]|uniref:hypothetical protein n=1 Tax=Thermofilum sp. TaxID=1961369 RepID=UPI0025900AB0|nr:hypothetical protein [Thermofilum sp.]